MKAVILANGEFPSHPTPLNELLDAPLLVCCDGAIENLEKLAITPNALVGDLDSIKEHLKKKYQSILHHDPDQNTNDLTKAVKWCIGNRINDIVIVGATGKREDHTLGNIGLLSNYARMGANVKMLTDTGVFYPLLSSSTIGSYVGQQVSIFSPNNQTVITTKNLKYPIENKTLPEFWMGTLNESLGDKFEISFSPGPLIIYLKY
ncbi:thiamine diphosphokinase [Tenuifilum thalassicum]|uniref:Thiamine diphosphokinase n=1 Tax=Tenuifilum thalassicum TaxID=2590900 RepID=A0A7D3XET0_9BACT|nr:thiamine diphosphokinase [Tenuifilum thalassicum]QKG80532.1 thiamine diphosphokinase [Tenuifilum thalassicum]